MSTLPKNPYFAKELIAKLLGASPKCVSATKKRYSETGSVSDRSRPSSPRKLTFCDESCIYIEEYRRDQLKEFFSKSGYIYRPHRSRLTARNLEATFLLWYKQKLNWTVNDWYKVMLSDESNFEVFNLKSRVIFHPKFCIPRLQTGGISAGLWGCISYKGTVICNIYTRRINQFVYINTLENNLLPSSLGLACYVTSDFIDQL
ncbi:transposable element Tcb1 transposase [Brachionus plicatilis]|uniref:Transposable element Tcb1 transposase n=1 Tax=Brachionus plicatilis TaxID=10195 RepID=A0A3M7SNT5_BRAPC|nr:transposable element Tcb1 transposase [Brachionus plicatilis]